jgi:hypothetical protein
MATRDGVGFGPCANVADELRRQDGAIGGKEAGDERDAGDKTGVQYFGGASKYLLTAVEFLVERRTAVAQSRSEPSYRAN